MATSSSSSSPNTPQETLTSSTTFVSSFQSYFKSLSPNPTPTPPPLSFDLLSRGAPLPPIPPDLPQPKLIPRTRFLVDAFRSAGDFSVTYFLSHFHSDHYTGLSLSWSKGLIFCSDTTARLLVQILKVPEPFVVPLPLNRTILVDGCRVQAVDANHCPGAVQFLFEIPVATGGRRTERYVHTGDFRYCDWMKTHPHLCRFVGADAIFLDTTYCNPKFVFPSQEESVNYVASTIKRIRDENRGSSESIVFFIATYVVGKEKILLETASRCECLVHVDSRKMKILSMLGFGESRIFTDDALATNIHVIGWNLLGETWPYFRPNFVKMKELMMERGFSKAVGFVSTGWMYETKRDGFAVRVKDSLEIHLVPYSEHSSYDELREYIGFLRPKCVIPTVGVDFEKVDSKHTIAMQKHFRGLVDETANKQEFLKAFHHKSKVIVEGTGDDPAVCTNDEHLQEMSNPPLEVAHSDERAYLQDSDLCKNESMQGAIQELQDSMPSWVTLDQIVDLLRSSGGDIVEAVSDFFEHERELYEQVNAGVPTFMLSPQQVPSGDFAPCSHKKSSQRNPDSGVRIFSDHDKKSTSMSIGELNHTSPKKRSLATGSKPKKKGRSRLTQASIGCKQSTITKFFGRVLSSSTDKNELLPDSRIAAQSLRDENELVDNSVEMYKQEVDQFLQIINVNIPRSAAASLVEKAKGSIDAALDIYYRSSGYFPGNEERVTGQAKTCDLASIDAVHISKETNLPSLFALRASSTHSVQAYVSLSIEKYSPIEHACWNTGQPAPYLHLARTFDLVEREKGKLKTTAMLCNMFRSLLALSPEDVLPAVYLCTNRIAAHHENMELNIGGNLVVAALEEACGTTRSKIREMYITAGDLGDVAQECRQTQSLLAPPRPLSIRNLFEALRTISTQSGCGSASRRKSLVVNLMRSCREMEMKFLVRTLVRNSRIGAMMRTILPALAQAVVLNNYFPMQPKRPPESLNLLLQSMSSTVAEAYNVLPNLDLLIPSLLNKGIEFSASTLAMVAGTPVPPMLARIANGAVQVLKTFQGRAFTCEYKYDGQRAQIHRLTDGSIRIFSRQMKVTTSKFPDLISIINELCSPSVSTFILDAEIVGVDRKNGYKIMSFQELSSRERGGRDSSVAMASIKVDICIFIFDIIFSNGERLLTVPLRERRKCLKNVFHNEKLGYLEYAKEMPVEADEADMSNHSTVTKINSFLEDAYCSSCEGIMVKSLDVDAGYSASKRTEAWLKIKRDYVEGLGDCLDLVPVGAWHGNGRKAGWYSPFLMACYNPSVEEYQSVCRVMSGFSDSFYMEMKEFFSGEKILPKKPPYYQTDESPDVWFSPELVWEIRGADFTISPVHHAAIGLVHPSRGISVRLPRYIRSLSDRNPEDCSTAEDIACMFNSQTRKMEVNKHE